MNSVRFALSAYAGEPVKLFDEIEDYATWCHLLLFLGGKLPFSYDVKSYEEFTTDNAFKRRYVRCPMD